MDGAVRRSTTYLARRKGRDRCWVGESCPLLARQGAEHLPLPLVDRQTHVKILPSLILRTWLVIVTARIRRMGKVLFSQVSVCPHFGVGVPTFQLKGEGIPTFQLTGETYLPANGGSTYLGQVPPLLPRQVPPASKVGMPCPRQVPPQPRQITPPHTRYVNPPQSKVGISSPSQGNYPPSKVGTPPPSKVGTSPIQGRYHLPPPQHSEYLLRGGRYASCVHTGGLSCYICHDRSRC